MGTRARIGILNVDGTVTSIYTHWDGYPEHHGPILTANYTDEASIRQLLSFGDVSSLEKRCIPSGPHSFDAPEPDVTIYYGRDRGETDTLPVTHPCDEWPESGQAYEYLFSRGHWRYRSGYQKNAAWVPLKPAEPEPSATGATCKKCNDHNPYAEASDSYVCFGCRV